MLEDQNGSVAMNSIGLIFQISSCVIFSSVENKLSATCFPTDKSSATSSVLNCIPISVKFNLTLPCSVSMTSSILLCASAEVRKLVSSAPNDHNRLSEMVIIKISDLGQPLSGVDTRDVLLP
jgi:hypothetical protein